MRLSKTDPERLLRRLHYYLSEAVGGSKHLLREWGWYEFMRLDCPPVESVESFAAEAVLYLCVTHGTWNGRTAVLVGVLAFLRHETEISPNEPAIRGLRALLREQPIDTETVRRWFVEAYGQR